MWRVMPDVFTKDWKKCSTSYIKEPISNARLKNTEEDTASLTHSD